MQIDLYRTGGPRSAVGVAVVGSVNLDTILRARRFPREGETLTGATVLDALGGKGSNQAVAAARLGASVAMVACLGHDAAGQTALDALRSDAVDVGACRRTSDAATGRAAIIVDDAGRNTIVVADGANALLGRGDVARATGLIAQAGVVLCQLEIPLATVDTAFASARDAGALTCLNTAPALAIDALATTPDVLIANRGEAEALTGISGSTAELAVALAQRYGTRLAVVTDGERGATAFDGEETFVAPALPVDVRDTTGAGDAFVGAFVAQLAAGVAHEAALRVACASGSLATRTPGAMPSLPHAAEVHAALSGQCRNSRAPWGRA
jgi:ribokinase